MISSKARDAAGSDPSVTSDDPRTDAADPVAQLTYSAAAEGYRVQDTTGDPTPDEIRELVARIPARAGFGVEVPDFLVPEEAAGTPRRLKFERLPVGAAFWHLAPAGRDASGRPNNVFTHAVLIRGDAANPAEWRPIQLWRSPDWLAPFGPAAVADTKLPTAAAPSPGPVVDRAAVVDFLTDTRAWRGDVLAVLLDAIAGEHRRPIVLGVESQNNAALWIGAISHLMSPATAWSTGFSVLETAATVAELGGSEIVVACVPRDTLAEVVGMAGAVVIDELGEVTRGSLQGPPHCVGGVEVPVTPWSGLADAVLSLADDIEADLARIDEIASAVGDHGLFYAWPLAMTVAENLDEYGHVADQALAVIQQHTPERIGQNPRLMRTIEGVIRGAVGPGTASMWSAFSADPRRSRVVLAAMRAEYVRRALHDHGWLLAPGGTPTTGWPEQPGFTVQESQRLAAEIVEWLDASSSLPADEVERLTVVLRAVDACYRLGLRPGEQAAGLSQAMRRATSRSASSLPGVVDAAPLDATFLREIGRPLLSREPGSEFEVLADETLCAAVGAVLHARGLDTLADEIDAGLAGDPTEWDIRAILEDPDRARGLPQLAPWALRSTASLDGDPAGTGQTDAQTAQLLRALYSDGRPTCADIEAAARVVSGGLPELVVVSALFSDGDAPGAQELCRGLRDRLQAARGRGLASDEFGSNVRWLRACEAFECLTRPAMGFEDDLPGDTTATRAVGFLESVLDGSLSAGDRDLVKPTGYMAQRAALAYLVTHLGRMTSSPAQEADRTGLQVFPARSELEVSTGAFEAFLGEFRSDDMRRRFFASALVAAAINSPDFDGPTMPRHRSDRAFASAWIESGDTGRPPLETCLIDGWHMFSDAEKDVLDDLEDLVEGIGKAHGSPATRGDHKFVKSVAKKLQRESKGGRLRGVLR